MTLVEITSNSFQLTTMSCLTFCCAGINSFLEDVLARGCCMEKGKEEMSQRQNYNKNREQSREERE